MEPHVFTDEGEAEADAFAGPAPTRTTAPREAFEDEPALFLGHAGALVLDGDLHAVVDAANADAPRAVAVLARVVEQVGDHTRQSALVGLHHDRGQFTVDLERHARAIARHADRLHEEFRQPDLVELEAHR